MAALSEPAIPAPVARIAPSEVQAPSADPVAHAEAAAPAPEPAETAGRAGSGEPEATLPALPARLVEATSPDGAAATPPAGPDAAATARPVRDLADPAQARAVQHRLADLGFFHAAATGLWGPRSRQALAAFKARSGLPRTDAWDEPTERSLFGAELRNVASFVGLWAPDAQACTPQLKQGGLLPATINEQGAWAGETSCQFQRRKQTGTVSTIVASCFDQRRRWTANVRIETHGDRLTWSSEQGSQTYVRCRAGQLYAQLAN